MLEEKVGIIVPAEISAIEGNLVTTLCFEFGISHFDFDGI